MDSSSFSQNKTKRHLVRLRKTVRAKWFIYFLCLCFSFGIWISITFSQERSDTVVFNVEYVRQPEHYTLINQPPTKIFVHFTGTGYSLQKIRQKQKEILQLDISGASLQSDNNQHFVAFRTMNMESYIFNQLSIDGSIKSITPDSITMIYEKNVSKEVPVRLSIDYQIKSQHWCRETPQFFPETVVIEGIESDIDSITEIRTAYHDFGTLSDSLHLSLALQKPATQHPLIFSTDSVQLIIPVEQFTEKTLTIPINAITGNPDYQLKIFTEKVNIRCLVSLSQFQQLSETMFEAQVEYNELKDNEIELLPIQIVRQPNFIEIIKIIPEQTEFLLIKK